MKLTRGIMLACLFIAAPAAAADLSREQQIAILAEAQQAFAHGIDIRRSEPKAAEQAFADAVSRYQLLIDSGLHNGGLYYNLGNASLESGQIGRAILNYRRADRLLRGDGRIDAMLRYARSLRRNEIPPTGERALLHTLFFWHFTTSLQTRYTLAVAAYLAFWLLLIIRMYAPRRGLLYAMIPCALLVAAMGGSVAIESNQHATYREGVIVADDVVARKGGSEGFEPQFQQKLHQGVEFSLLEKRGDWLHVEMPDGKSGWIRAGQAELI